MALLFVVPWLATVSASLLSAVPMMVRMAIEVRCWGVSAAWCANAELVAHLGLDLRREVAVTAGLYHLQQGEGSKCDGD